MYSSLPISICIYYSTDSIAFSTGFTKKRAVNDRPYIQNKVVIQ